MWRYNINSRTLGIIYDRRSSSNGILSGVDNVTVSSDGHVLVAEDGGDMQIVVIGPFGDVFPLLQVTGQSFSEITGPAFNAEEIVCISVLNVVGVEDQVLPMKFQDLFLRLELML